MVWLHFYAGGVFLRCSCVFGVSVGVVVFLWWCGWVFGCVFVVVFLWW